MAAQTVSAQTAGSEILFSVGIEAIGVGLLALLAGANDDVGTLVVLFVVGLWVLFFVTESSVTEKLFGAFTRVQKAE